MRLRSIIHVAGPRGVGKTAFIEALLRSDVALATCVRGECDPGLRGEHESASRRQPEVRRYLDAGATAAAVYRFAKPDADSFHVSDVMQEYSQAVLIEGDCPIDYVELSVFVAPPLPPGRALVRRVKREHRAEHAAELAALERAGENPDAFAAWLSVRLGSPLGALLSSSHGVMSDMSSRIRALLPVLRKARPPAPTVHWALAKGYQGIEQAGLIVVNLRGEKQREGAEAVVAGVARLRKDPAIFDDVLGFRGNRTPVTAVVTNLADAKDAGLRKAVARVKRGAAQR